MGGTELCLRRDTCTAGDARQGCNAMEREVRAQLGGRKEKERKEKKKEEKKKKRKSK